MSVHIIEAIHAKGITHTKYDHRRATTPRPGDVVEFPAGLPYPFDKGGHGIIDHIRDDRISICCGLYGDGPFLNDDGSLSTSGGPFAGVDRHRLVPTMRLMPVRFWNWGNNGAGSGNGVTYMIERPVFTLLKEGEINPADLPF